MADAIGMRMFICISITIDTFSDSMLRAPDEKKDADAVLYSVGSRPVNM